jgi:hypothetical protein
MKVLKSDFKYLARLILTWTFLNLILNLLGLFMTKHLNKAEYTPLDNVTKEFIIPLIVQVALFSLCLFVAWKWMKERKFVPYLFAAFQFVIFHLIFFLNLKVHQGIHFESTFNNIGLKYLSNSGQYLIDILYLYFPINGNFDNGLFMPEKLGTFYIHWILLNIVYYIALTWITLQVSRLLFERKDKIQAKPEENELSESQE